MPYTVTTNPVVDGQRQAVVHVTYESDGSGEINLAKIIDATNDIYPKGVKTDTTIMQIWWGNSYFDAFLYTNDLVPQLICVLPVGSEDHTDFRSFGGLKVQKTLDGNGDILLSTSGFAPAGSKGFLVIELKKD